MKLTTYLTLALSLCLAAVPAADGAHVAAGVLAASGQEVKLGDALAFFDEDENVVTQSAGVLRLNPGTGANLGRWVAASDTYFALAGSPALTGPLLPFAFGRAYEPKDPRGAGTGTFIEMHLINMIGPEGSDFRWTESGAAAPSAGWTLGVGPFGTGFIPLTESTVRMGNPETEPSPTTLNGDPPIDPFGHVHGRRYTFSHPGDYTITYVLKDRYGKQADSTPYTVNYASPIPEPATVGCLLLGAGLLAGCRFRRKHGSRSES